MRYRLPALTLMILASTTTWLPELAAAAPLSATTTHIAEEFNLGRQTVTVKGRLFCNGQPSTSTQSQVFLINKRIGQDDVAKMYPSNDGTFTVSLTVDSVSAIAPQLEIRTGCGATAAQRCRQFTLRVPDRYVNSADPWDIGPWYLEQDLQDVTAC